MVKIYISSSTEQRQKYNGITLDRLMNKTIQEKTMKNSRNRTDARLVNKETKVIKTKLCASQTKSLDNDLVAIRKTKINLMLKKPAYITIFILELRKY